MSFCPTCHNQGSIRPLPIEHLQGLNDHELVRKHENACIRGDLGKANMAGEATANRRGAIPEQLARLEKAIMAHRQCVETLTERIFPALHPARDKDRCDRPPAPGCVVADTLFELTSALEDITTDVLALSARVEL